MGKGHIERNNNGGRSSANTEDTEDGVHTRLVSVNDDTAGDGELSRQERYFLESLYAYDLSHNITDTEATLVDTNSKDSIMKFFNVSQADINQFISHYGFEGGEKSKINRILEDAKYFYNFTGKR